MALFYPKPEQKKSHFPSDFAIFTAEDDTVVDHCWFRGGWWDPFTMAWNAVKDGKVNSNPPVPNDAPGASLYVPFKLAPGQKKEIKVMMAWYTPDSEHTYRKNGHPQRKLRPCQRLLQYACRPGI